MKVLTDAGTPPTTAAHGLPDQTTQLADGRPAKAPGVAGNPAWQAGAAGAAAVILGLLILTWPGLSLVAAGTLFGCWLLISGVTQLVGASAAHVPTHLRALAACSGAINVLVGLLCFRGAAESVLLLAIWIGIGWMLRGITQISMALHDMPARGWQAVLGAVGIVAGIVVIMAPFSSITSLALVAGLLLVASGLVEIGHGIRLRLPARHPSAG